MSNKPERRKTPNHHQPTANIQAGQSDGKTSQFVQVHAGPLPPPAILKEYNEILPDMAERLLRLVESEQKHRWDFEHKALEIEIKDKEQERKGSRLNQILGFALVGSLLLVTVLFACIGMEWGAVVSVIATASPLLRAWFRTKEKEDKSASTPKK